jgi:hypothetical protein
MSSVEIPSASAVESKEITVEVVEVVEMASIVATLKSLDQAELFKVMKVLIAEAEKRAKGGPAGAKVVAKKSGSMPKGVVPPQLRKPRAWVDFTLKHSLEHGWEAFTVYQTKKDKTTGEKTDEEIEMPASELHDGAHVYKDSVDEKHPAGKQLIHKDAMSLSKQRWAPKEKAGTHHALYQEFEGAYVEEVVPVNSSEVVVKKVVVRKTAAEKEAEAATKKAEKDAATAAKKAEKEVEKEAKKAEKEAEKEAKKAEKEAEKEAKKAAKVVTVVAKAAVPAAAVKKAVAVKAVVKAAAAAVPTPKKAPVAAAKAVAVWSCPKDGMVHPWPYKTKQYLRNSDNEVWVRGEDGGCGEWQGVYLPAEDRIDDSVAEPVFDDEE